MNFFKPLNNYTRSIMILVALSFFSFSQLAEAQLAPNLRRAVVLEAYHAIRPSADGGCDYTLPDKNGSCVSSWNYLADDYSAYVQLKDCKTSSVWQVKTDECKAVSVVGTSVPYSYYADVWSYGFNRYNIVSKTWYTPSYGRGGQCKHFANLILYRSGADTRVPLPSYSSMTNSSLRLNSATNLSKVKEGDIIFDPNAPHTTIVVSIQRQNGAVVGLTVIDSNWVGGNNNEIIGKHTMSTTALLSYRIWQGSAYYNTTYELNSHWQRSAPQKKPRYLS